MLSRRDFLKLVSLVTASVAVSSCASIYRKLASNLPAVPWTPLDAREFLMLNRLTFGPRVEERAGFIEIGWQAWVEEQLDFGSINDFECELQLNPFRTLKMHANELEAISNGLFDDYDRQTIPNELRQATLMRQTYSKRQLYELMVEFWSDHFNIYVEKGNCFYLKTVDDREVIRKYALGSFRDLVWASAHSPAMLVYLDNQANEKTAPNENYARELMELHTLGVDGGYTQQDVMELARCLTGWNIKQHFWLGDFVFKEDLHDTGVKQVLGQTIPPSGIREGEQVIEHLVTHHSTAHFIATKLTRRFIADEPPPEIVKKAAQAFLNTNGDIKSVLRVILLDGLPLAQPKYKRPANVVLSALRILNAETNGVGVQEYLLRMGQAYFNWPTPDGYPDDSEAWQGNLMPRWQFAFEFIRNEIKGTRHNLNELIVLSASDNAHDHVDAVAALLLGAPMASSARDDLIDALIGAGASEEEALLIITAGLIASPAFQWR